MSQCPTYVCTNVIPVHEVAIVIRGVLIAPISMGDVQTLKAENEACFCY